MGHRRRPGVQPARSRARGGRDRARSRASSCARERVQGRRIVSVLIRGRRAAASPTTGDAAVDATPSGARRPRDVPLRLRHAGRPAQRREVDARQPAWSAPKVAIVSDRPQTTRTQIRGVRTTADSQIVLLDTPGIHKPRTLLGRAHQRARPRHARRGRRRVRARRGERADRARRPVRRRARAAGRHAEDPRGEQDRPRRPTPRWPSTSRSRPASWASSTPTCRCRRCTGDGVDALVGELEARLPEGPHYYPDGVVTDQPETFLAAELVREQLLRVARDELPALDHRRRRGDRARRRRGPRDRDGRTTSLTDPALGTILVERDRRRAS